MTMDYRYFLMNNQLYYDELSTMSLLMANSIYMKDSGIKIEDKNNVGNKNLKIKDFMEFFGFENVKTYYMGSSTDSGYEEGDITRNYKDTHKGRVAIGYKNIEYHGIEKAVIGIIIRGTAEDDDWDNDFDMGDLKLRDILQEDYEGGYENYRTTYEKVAEKLRAGILDKYDKKYSNELLHFAGGYPDWTHRYHHAGFDIVANRILEVIEKYIDDEGCSDMNGDIVYWVTGHSMGGGVANIVAAELLHSANGINDRNDNVYCYTFAAPNTFYITDNTYERDHNAIEGKKVKEQYREPQMTKYRCIFNIVNDDDFVPRLPMRECNWTKYGRTVSISYNSTTSLKTIQPRMDEHLSTNERFTYVKYRGSKDVCDNVIEGFITIFDDDKENMRAYSYKYDSIVTKTFPTNVGFTYRNKYVAPFQKQKMLKHSTIEWTFEQEQMPAYFLNIIAGTMHTKNNTGITLNSITDKINLASIASYSLGEKYYLPRNRIIINKDNIQPPHYLESYYELIKRITISDIE